MLTKHPTRHPQISIKSVGNIEELEDTCETSKFRIEKSNTKKLEYKSSFALQQSPFIRSDRFKNPTNLTGFVVNRVNGLYADLKSPKVQLSVTNGLV